MLFFFMAVTYTDGRIVSERVNTLVTVCFFLVKDCSIAIIFILSSYEDMLSFY